jgi:hypothetical protein
MWAPWCDDVRKAASSSFFEKKEPKNFLPTLGVVSSARHYAFGAGPSLSPFRSNPS